VVQEKDRTALFTHTNFPGRSVLGRELVCLAAFYIATGLAGQHFPSEALHQPESAGSVATHEQLGDQLLAAHRFEQAAVEYQKALTAGSAVAALHEKLGMAFVGSGNMQAAAHEFGEAVRLDRVGAFKNSNEGQCVAQECDILGSSWMVFGWGPSGSPPDCIDLFAAMTPCSARVPYDDEDRHTPWRSSPRSSILRPQAAWR
jgi:hypothetical protein